MDLAAPQYCQVCLFSEINEQMAHEPVTVCSLNMCVCVCVHTLVQMHELRERVIVCAEGGCTCAWSMFIGLCVFRPVQKVIWHPGIWQSFGFWTEL